MRTILWFIYFWGYLLLVLPKLKKAQRLRREGNWEEHDRLVRKEVQGWATKLLQKAGVQVQVEGLENIPQGPCVFVGNHQGYFDIPLLLSCLDCPHPLIAKMEIAKIPLVRGWMEELRCLFIDRENARQAMDCLKEANNLLQEGYSVVIFPEGTRSKGGPIKDFKGGGIRLATRAKVPVVPLCIEGTYKVMEQNHYWIHPAQVRLRILSPVETAGLNREQIRALDEELQQLLTRERQQLLAQEIL